MLLLLILPWLYPFATGPTPAVGPWLFGFACGTLLWLGRAQLTPAQILRGWVVAATLSAVFGLLQYAGATRGLAPWVAPAGPGEAYGNLRQRNQFATLMNMGVAAALWLAALDSKGKPLRNAALLISAVLLGSANAASASRTGMVQLVLLAVAVWWWALWHKALPRRLLFAAILAYLIASLVLPVMSEQGGAGIWARLKEGNAVCASRLTLWGNVLQLIAAQPWTGWGWGELDYAHFMTLYPGERFCDILDNAHNLPLHLAVELGLPIASLLCGAAGLLVLRARPWREIDPARQAAWTVLALILLHSMLEYPLWYGPFQIAAGLCIWLLGQASYETRGSEMGGRRLNWERFLAGALLTLTAYAQWDYHRVSQIYLPPEQRDEAYREHTLEKVKGSWLFAAQARFAEFSTTELTPENAARLNAQAHELLHYSPEARVVEKLIESAVMQDRQDEARQFLLRYQAAYPKEYERWKAHQNR
jgi:O-antigen ligase